MTDEDRLLTAKEAGAACDPPMSASDWRGRVARGKGKKGPGIAPQADDPGDLSAPANRRTPKWRASKVAAFNDSRRKPGRPRTQFISSPDSPFEIVRREKGSPRRKFMLREKNSGRVVDTFATAAAAKKYLAEALDKEFADE